MALNKTIQAPNGVSLSYWKIDSVNLNPVTLTAVIRISGYIDRANRDSFSATTTNSYAATDSDFMSNFDHAVLDAAGNNPIKAAYEWLKTQTDFNGATDVLEDELEIA